MDRRIRQTATASPAEPGDLPLTIGCRTRTEPIFSISFGSKPPLRSYAEASAPSGPQSAPGPRP